MIGVYFFGTFDWDLSFSAIVIGIIGFGIVIGFGICSFSAPNGLLLGL